MAKKTIITAALTGAWPKKENNPNVPMTPSEIADDVYAAWKEGAAIAHLHMRDDEGNGTMETAKFEETMQLLRERYPDCDIIINMTTSGDIHADDELRVAHVKKLRPEMASYDCGTMNWMNSGIFVNSPKFLENCGLLFQELGVKPEIEAFDPGMIANAAYYLKKGVLKAPLHFQFCMGCANGIPGSVKNLVFMKETMDQLCPGSTWSTFGVGHAAMENMYAAVAMGGHIRVGMQMHQQNLTMAMMDVWSACRADINIMDAMHAASGYSPHMPVPIDTNLILGSKDPVAIDRVACEVTGIDTTAVDYFRVAEETGLGNYDMDQIEVVGDSIETCYKKMWIPYIGDMSSRWPEYDVKCEGACSSCQALLAINMEELKAVDEYEKNKGMTIVIGGKNEIPKDIPDEKIVLHGNCTRKYLKDHPNAYWILGCPPNEPALYLTVQRKEVINGMGDQEEEIIRPCMARDAAVWHDYVFAAADKYYAEHQND